MELPYQQYFEAMPCYVTVQGPDFKLVAANRRFRRDFGEIDGRTCFQVYKRRAEKCEDCPVERTFRDGETHQSQERVRCEDGRQVDVLVATTPIRGPDGEVSAVMEISTDVTDLTQLHGQLRKSQERFRRLFEEVPCYITVQDANLKIVDANRRFLDDFGNGMGCDCYRTYKHRDEPCIPCPVADTFADGQVHRSEEVVTSRQGEAIHTLVYTTPIYGSDGTIEKVMEMSTNITPIRELQSQLESTGLLISSVSHGIKGLLSGLDGGVYLVNSGMKKGDDTRVTQGWEMVQRNVERIRSMVLNILYYAKEREPLREDLPAAELAREVVEVVRSRAAEHQVEIRTKVPEELGTFSGDATAMRALLVNLLENSIDACRVDTKKTPHWLAFDVTGTPEAVTFAVSDNGIGMDQETREKAFSLFFSSKGAKGTGLGLFIAKNIAVAHGGHIDLTSEPGSGSRLGVTIPRSYSGPERTIVPREQGASHERRQEDHLGG